MYRVTIQSPWNQKALQNETAAGFCGERERPRWRQETYLFTKCLGCPRKRTSKPGGYSRSGGVTWAIQES